MQDFAKEHDTYVQVIRDVAMGHTTSARLSKAIDDRIKEADRVYQEHRKKKVATVNA